MFINPLFLRNDKEKIDGADGCRINKIKFRNRWVHPEGWYFEEDDYPDLARDFACGRGRNELFDCRREREGGTKNRIPRSRHFSRQRDATTRQKSEIISRENSPPDSVHFSWRRGVDGNWLPPWPSPLPSFSLLLLLLRFFAPPTSSSSSLLLSRWFIESVNDSSPLFLITRANSALPRLSWRIDFEEKVWKEASVLISFQGTRCILFFFHAISRRRI